MGSIALTNPVMIKWIPGEQVDLHFPVQPPPAIHKFAAPIYICTLLHNTGQLRWLELLQTAGGDTPQQRKHQSGEAREKAQIKPKHSMGLQYMICLH